jgi:hypothetical protein
MSSIENTMGVQNPGLLGKGMELAGTIAPLLIGGGAKTLSIAGDAASGFGKLADLFRPQKQAQGIIDSLGQGKSLEENAQSLALDVKNAFSKNKEDAEKLYDPVFNNEQVASGSVTPSEYKSLDADIFDGYDRDLKNLNKKFLSNPSFENAHNLQSQLGTLARKLEGMDNRGNLPIADRSIMQGYNEARSALRSDMASYLDGISPGLKDQYSNATENFDKNVVPYIKDTAIAKIAKGQTTNPDISSIKSIFGSPEPDIKKIVNDIGPEANRKILFSEIGKMGINPDAKKLANALDDSGLLDKSGLSTYSTPEFKDSIDALAKSISYSRAAKIGAGISGATVIGKHLPLISYLIPGGH